MHPAFELLRTQTIPSLHIEFQEYRHRVTGAQHIHLRSNHEENVFLVAFRTIPMDSTGVAHILEHTALCGSRRYPVRDPFFMMTRRSLNTFMNAFTSSDWTAYPFASQNAKDFDNLLSVYLDAAFFSRLDPLDFAQEGHRLALESAEDSNSPLVYKGVVFNEMKGSMSSPVNYLYDRISTYLFPTTTYHYNSGGDPAHIVDLTYEQLKTFYQTHYHPSNAIFVTFGNRTAEQHHAVFEQLALSHFSKLDKHFEVPLEKSYCAPLTIEEAYPVDKAQGEQKQTHHVLAWLLDPITDAQKRLELQLLSNILLDNSAAPLRKALETFKHASAPSPLCGLEDDHFQMSFMCGVEGSDPEQAEAVEKCVFDVLHELVNKGVEQQRIEAVLHQLELHQRELKGDGYPYGLQLILRLLPACVHRSDPMPLLDIEANLASLREKIKDPQWIPQLIQTELLNNRHRVRLTLKPDAELQQVRVALEKQKLATLRESLSNTQIQAIIAQNQALDARQNQPEDDACLPKVGLADVPAELIYPRADKFRAPHPAGPVTQFNEGTNGLVYQQVLLDLPELTAEELDLLPFYTGCIPELGCGQKDYLLMQDQQSAVSGGIHAFYQVRNKIDNLNTTNGHLVLSTKGLYRNQQAMTGLLQETLESVRFDELARIRELIAQDRAHREQSITQNGHSLAMTAASAYLGVIPWLQHKLGGLLALQQLKKLDDSLEDKNTLAAWAKKLTQLHQKMLRMPRQFLLIGEQTHVEAMQNSLQQHWQASQATTEKLLHCPAPPAPTSQVWLTNTQVNFCAQAYATVPSSHADSAALTVLGGYLRNGFLHRTIREQGGAYGGGAGHDASNGVFRFYSYRDPRLSETLKDFHSSLQWLFDAPQKPEQLEEAILGVISQLDKPGSPAGEAKQAFHNELYGRTEAFRKASRQRILEVTLEDLRRVTETYLRQPAQTAVITQTESWQQHKDQLALQEFYL